MRARAVGPQTLDGGLAVGGGAAAVVAGGAWVVGMGPRKSSLAAVPAFSAESEAAVTVLRNWPRSRVCHWILLLATASWAASSSLSAAAASFPLSPGSAQG